MFLLFSMLMVMNQAAAVQAAGSHPGAATVPAVWVSLNKTSDIISLDSEGVVHNTDQLTAAVLPVKATDQTVNWKSSNPAVATVDQTGLVTAVALGMTDITATTQDGGFSAACAVTVNYGSNTGNAADGCPPAPELTIRTGYPGGNYTTLHSFTPAELSDPAKFTQHQQAYTFIDNMPVPVLDSCQGVLLSDILNNVGISLNNVQSFSFYTEDVPSIVGAFTTLTASKLYEARYYYPNLTNSDNYQVVNGIFTPNDPAASSGAVQVYPMIALEDNWKRFATAPDFADVDNNTQFRLVYGEADDTTHDASTSAKWVFQIDVTLNGTPVAGVAPDKAGGATPGSSTPTLAPSVFTDVPDSYWASGVIEDLSGKGYINGYPDGTFRPDAVITRAEFVAMLAKILKLLAYTPAEPDFSDVSSTDWCYGSVEEAVHAGIVKGNGGSFAPDDPITREQMAVMTAKAAGRVPAIAGAAAVSFTDSSRIDAWATGAVAAVVQDGIMKGYPDGTFGPGKEATRAEAAVVIANAFKQ